MIQAREELLEKESTNSVKDAAMEKLVADVLDDETKSDELGFDIKSSEDEEKMEVIFFISPARGGGGSVHVFFFVL